MTISEPTKKPRWADDPPAAPPTTIVEPTEGEKDEGFQKTDVAQVDDVTIDTVTNSTLYQFEIGGLAVQYTSTGAATDSEIRDGLIAAGEAIGAIAAAVNFTTPASNRIRITADPAGTAVILTESDSRLSTANVTPNKNAKPSRQFINWLFNLIYQWILFLDGVRFRWSDVGGNWFVPDSETLPSNGGGLTGTSGAVTAYIQGRRVFGTSEAHLYTASRDTYLDLTRDAVWVYAPVANGAGAPAVTANAVRVFKVVTDATDRTVVTSLIEATVSAMVDVSKKWRFRNLIELGRDLIALALTTATTPRIRHLWTQTAYNLITDHVESSGASHRLVRRYIGTDGQQIETVNASWDHTNTRWVKDTAAPSSKTETTNVGTAHFYHPSNTTPFTDALFQETSRSGPPLRLGVGYLDSAADANTERLAIPYSQFDAGTLTQIANSVGADTEGVHGMRWFRDNATGAWWRLFNATWDDATEEWVRVAAGDSYRFAEGPLGLVVEKHTAGEASPWVEGAWTLLFDVGNTGVVLAESIEIAGALTVNGLTTLSGDVVSPNVPLVYGRLRLDGASGFTSIGGQGYTPTVNTNYVEIAFDAVIGTPYYVLCSQNSLNSDGAGLIDNSIAVAYNLTSTGFRLGAMALSAGSLVLDGDYTAGQIRTFGFSVIPCS